MKLMLITLHGYKRFERQSSMKVDGKLIAVVGPNEAGKSSLLQALTRLNDHEPLSTSAGTRETTRNATIPDDQHVIQARYLLETEDREELSDVHGGEEIRWCTVSKRVDGTHIYDFEPRPTRSLQPRSRIVQKLSEVSSRKGFLKLAEEYEESDLTAEVEELALTLDTEKQTIPNEALEEIESVAASLEDAVSDEGLKYLRDLKRQLRDLAEHETGDPVRQSIDILAERRPTFLMFSQDKRLLQSDYDLNEIHDNPPAALGNLAQLAGLDLEALYDAASANDSAEVASIEGRANEQLREQFEVWSQSEVAPKFRIEEQVLKVLVRELHESKERFTTIAERSDGLRQFIALLAFTFSESSKQKQVLLIDEAETHLHYDAQADLVQMLARQELVAKVIYTTHSIGCLPEDLGTGVRFIESNEPESYTSRVENSFWTSNKSGFSPLLFGMGASTLAFIPVRNAVIAEGPSDMILWPTLLREATGRAYLDFQVAPGLSNASPHQTIVLDSEAPKTAYLLDSDEGGTNKRSQLIDAGISEGQIFKIPNVGGKELVLEDLLDADLYVRAVNEELRRYQGDSYSFPGNRLPTAGRHKEVEAWCNEHGIAPPNKPNVAYRVIEEGAGQTILAEHYHEPIRQLFADITDKLQS